jgi:hypothetical protein
MKYIANYKQFISHYNLADELHIRVRIGHEARLELEARHETVQSYQDYKLKLRKE